MAGIDDLGNGTGYIYTVEPDKTTIVGAIRNTPEGARDIKVEAVKAQSVALNRKATGTITFTAPTGAGQVTAVTISGKNQINVAVSYDTPETANDVATNVANEINNFSAGANDYTATVSGDTITVIANVDAGADFNGDSIVVTNTGNITYSSSTVEGGSDATELYDLAIGYTFFLNSDYDAAGCGCSATPATPDSLTNAVEITDYIIPRSLTSAIDVQSGTIASGAVTITRKSLDTLLYIDTQAAASADDLDTITITGFAEGDKITLRGADGARIVTVKDGTGNIELEGGVDFDTAGFETAITLQLKDSTWYEVSRTSQAIGTMSNYRTAGFGFFGVDEYNTAAVATTGTVTFDGGTDKKYQKLTGTDTLTGNMTYALGTGVNGDEFWLEYDAAVTNAGNNLTIFGITLTDEQALGGGLMFRAKYMEGAWRSYVSTNHNRGNTNPYKAGSEAIGTEAVLVANVESNLKNRWSYVSVSFETGEQGDMKVTMPKCNVISFSASVKKAIAGTDNATIVPKNHAGTAMTSGTVTLTSSSAIGTQFTSTPTGNNSFAEGETMTLTTAKTTVGGKAIVSFRVLLT
jgi:hypothetical protein